MISAETLSQLESPQSPLPYILGVRMRKAKAMAEVLSRPGRFREVYPEGIGSKDPSPLQVKQVLHNGDRYIVCFNPRQARKDAQQREQILSTLGEQLKQGATSLIGNKGFRRYLKIDKGAAHIDEAKVKAEARYDGKWVLRTNTELSAEQVALKRTKREGGCQGRPPFLFNWTEYSERR